MLTFTVLLQYGYRSSTIITQTIFGSVFLRGFRTDHPRTTVVCLRDLCAT